MTRGWLAVLLLASSAGSLPAQTIDDSLMMRRNDFCTGFIYQHDAWDRYWEGSLKRGNENIGTITTQNVSWMGNYGITSRLNVIAMLPYVWTGASQGVLLGMKGVQDLTVAVKYNVLDTAFTSRGSLRTFVVASAGTPVGDYTPDFLPLSIGSASRSLSGRLTLHFQARPGWFVRGTGAYTWRGNVKLDRPAYYTNGQLFFSDQVPCRTCSITPPAPATWTTACTRRSTSRSSTRGEGATSAGRTCPSSPTA
jgi:hypothetical protein